MSTVQRQEHYVVYYDKQGRRYASLPFPQKDTAQQFMSAMLKQDAVKVTIEVFEYPYKEQE